MGEKHTIGKGKRGKRSRGLLYHNNIVLEEEGEFLSEGRGKLWSSVQDYLGVKAESRENMSKKELDNSCSINVFCAGAINYPLHKAMVYHDHN